jgi:hypothetical protein
VKEFNRIVVFRESGCDRDAIPFPSSRMWPARSSRHVITELAPSGAISLWVNTEFAQGAPQVVITLQPEAGRHLDGFA